MTLIYYISEVGHFSAHPRFHTNSVVRKLGWTPKVPTQEIHILRWTAHLTSSPAMQIYPRSKTDGIHSHIFQGKSSSQSIERVLTHKMKQKSWNWSSTRRTAAHLIQVRFAVNSLGPAGLVQAVEASIYSLSLPHSHSRILNLLTIFHWDSIPFAFFSHHRSTFYQDDSKMPNFDRIFNLVNSISQTLSPEKIHNFC